MRYDEGLDESEIANYESKHDITPNKIMTDNNKPTYELWFLGDIVGEPQAKSRATLNALLQEAHQMLTDAAIATLLL